MMDLLKKSNGFFGYWINMTEATPKRIQQMMGVKGLKISHVKSHLQVIYDTIAPYGVCLDS